MDRSDLLDELRKRIEELEDREYGDRQLPETGKYVKEQLRLLKAASKIMSSQLRSIMLGLGSSNAYSADQLGSDKSDLYLDRRLKYLGLPTSMADSEKNQRQRKDIEERDVQATKTNNSMPSAKDSDTLTSTNNDTSRYMDRIEQLQLLAIELFGRDAGPEHPRTLTIKASLASIYRIQGRLRDAEELYLQVIDTSKRTLGPEYPITLDTMIDLAWTYADQKRWKEAEELEVRVIESRRRILGSEHADTLTSMVNLASTYRNQGRLKEAESVFFRSFREEQEVIKRRKPYYTTQHEQSCIDIHGSKTVEGG